MGQKLKKMSKFGQIFEKIELWLKMDPSARFKMSVFFTQHEI